MVWRSLVVEGQKISQLWDLKPWPSQNFIFPIKRRISLSPFSPWSSIFWRRGDPQQPNSHGLRLRVVPGLRKCIRATDLWCTGRYWKKADAWNSMGERLVVFCLGGEVSVFWEFLISFDLEMVEDLVFGSSFLVKDYIDSKKRRKQFIFYIKFNHLFSCGTEWRWQFLSFLAAACVELWMSWFGFAGFKIQSQLFQQRSFGAAFCFGEREQTNLCRLLIRIKIIPALSDNYMPLGIKDVHAKVFLFSGIFFRRCFHPEWFAKDASQTFMLGHNWNLWRFSP